MKINAADDERVQIEAKPRRHPTKKQHGGWGLEARGTEKKPQQDKNVNPLHNESLGERERERQRQTESKREREKLKHTQTEKQTGRLS